MLSWRCQTRYASEAFRRVYHARSGDTFIFINFSLSKSHITLMIKFLDASFRTGTFIIEYHHDENRWRCHLHYFEDQSKNYFVVDIDDGIFKWYFDKEEVSFDIDFKSRTTYRRIDRVENIIFDDEVKSSNHDVRDWSISFWMQHYESVVLCLRQSFVSVGGKINFDTCIRVHACKTETSNPTHDVELLNLDSGTKVQVRPLTFSRNRALKILSPSLHIIVRLSIRKYRIKIKYLCVRQDVLMIWSRSFLVGQMTLLNARKNMLQISFFR